MWSHANPFPRNEPMMKNLEHPKNVSVTLHVSEESNDEAVRKGRTSLNAQALREVVESDNISSEVVKSDNFQFKESLSDKINLKLELEDISGNKKEYLRNLPNSVKQERNHKAEERFQASKKGKGKRKSNDSKKRLDITHRRDDEESFFFHGTYDQLQRKIEAQRKKERVVDEQKIIFSIDKKRNVKSRSRGFTKEKSKYHCESGVAESLAKSLGIVSVKDTLLGIFGDRVRSTMVFLYQIYRSRNLADILAASHQYGVILGLINAKQIESWVVQFWNRCKGSLKKWWNNSPSMGDLKAKIKAKLGQDKLEMTDLIDKISYSYPKDEEDCWYREKTFATEEDPYNIELKEYIKANYKAEDGEVLARLEQASAMFHSLMDGNLVRGLRNLCLSMASYVLVRGPVTDGIYKLFGPVSSMSLVSFVSSILDAFSNLVRFSGALLKGVPLSEALFSNDPINAALEECGYLLKMKDNTYTGLPDPSRIELKTYIGRAQAAVDLLRVATEKLSPRDKIRNYAKSTLVDMEIELNNKKAEVAGTSRVAPLGLCLVGPSGIGKSHLLPYFCHLFCDVKGYNWNPDLIYQRSATSDYFEGYNPWCHPIVHYSEVARFSKNITEGKGDDQINELISLIDTLAWRPDMAFKDKGKVFAIPDMVVCDTNNESLNADLLYACPVAFRRRFVFIKPVVKKQFRKEGTTMIDSVKCSEYHAKCEEEGKPDHMLDRYFFEIYTVSPTKDSGEKIVKLCDQATLLQATIVMRQFMEKHIENGERVRNEMRKIVPMDTFAQLHKKISLPLNVTPSVTPNVTPKPSRDSSPDRVPYRKVVNEADFDQKYEEDNRFDNPPQYQPSLIEEKEVEVNSTEDLTSLAASGMHPDPKQLVDALNVFFDKNNEAIDKSGPVDGVSFVKAITSLFKRDTLTDAEAFDKFYVEDGYLDRKRWKPLKNYLAVNIMYLMMLLQTLVSYVTMKAASDLMRDEGALWLLSPMRLLAWVVGIILSQEFFFWMAFLPLCFLSFGNILRHFQERMSLRMELFITSKIAEEKAALKHLILGYVHNPFNLSDNEKKWVKRMFGATVASIGLVTIWKALHPILIQRYALEQGKLSEEEESDILDRMGLGAAKQAVPLKTTNNYWNSVVYNPVIGPSHTRDMESLATRVSRNVRRIYLQMDGFKTTTHALLLGGGYFIINEHALRGKEEVTTTVVTNPNGNGREVVLRKKNSVKVCTDVLMFHSDVTHEKSILKHFATTKQSFSGMVGSSPMRAMYNTARFEISDSMGSLTLNEYYQYVWNKHQPGACGTPLVGNFNNGYVIYGIHVAGSDNDHKSIGIPITKDMLEIAMESMKPCVVFEAHAQSGKESGTVSSGLYTLDECKVDFEAPGVKSLVRYEELTEMDYLGKIPGPIIMNKSGSKLKLTSIADLVYDYFDEHHPGYVKMMPPVMKPCVIDGEWISPYNNVVRKMNKPKKDLDSSKLCLIRDFLVRRFSKQLREENVTRLNPVTIHEAVNGVEGDEFFRRVNASTSAGFGFTGNKFKHLPLVNPQTGERDVSPELLSCVRHILSLYEEGKRAYPVYRGQLKDEPRDPKKVLQASTRMFYMQSLDHLIVARMFLGPFYTLLPRFPHIFCSQVGINMFADADDFYRSMEQFSSEILEGDYGGYDVSMPIGIAACTSAIVEGVLRELGYSEQHLTIVRGICTDNMYPCIEILKDVFMVPGLQPSGKYATAEDNSLRGLVMLLYAWLEQGKDLKDFFELVRPCTYGDDLAAACKDPTFNAQTYAKVVRDVFGMTFTDPHKRDEFPPFVGLFDMSFLKRNFHYDERFGKIVGSLPPDSIVKCLTWTLPKSATSEEQLLSSVRSACYEYALINSKGYESFVSFLRGALLSRENFHLKEIQGALPSFDDVRAIVRGEETYCHTLPCDNDSLISEGSYLGSAQMGEVDGVPSFRLESGISLTTQPAEQIDMKEEYENLKKAIEDHAYFEAVFRSENSPEYVLMFESGEIPREYLTMIRRFLDLEATLPKTRFVTESGNLNVDTPTEVEKFENMEYTEEDDMVQNHAGVSIYPDIGQKERLGIQEFFARPIKIVETAFHLNGHTDLLYKIWNMYTMDAAVRAKLRNYSYFKANLHLKVAINGTPFSYGQVLLSYQPFYADNECLQGLSKLVTAALNMRPLLLNYLSQAPGSVVLDVKANESAEMVIPFISPAPTTRLFNDSDAVLSASTPFADIEFLGGLYVYTLNQILNANTSTVPPALVIYCWATEVELGVPTATQIEVANVTPSPSLSVFRTQSGDERKTGPVEKFSSAAVQVSDSISKVPYIAPYAKASSFIFKGIKTLSSIFGWSKPTKVGGTIIVKNEPYQNGANTIGWDTGKRVVIDPQQELLVDPRVAGSETDDMDIAEIARRKSYLTTFHWPTSNAAYIPMFRIGVTPLLSTRYTHDSKVFYQPTASCFAALPFRYWNGKMQYTFKIAASNFHRGKLGFWYEPNTNQQALTIPSTGMASNLQFLKVIDLQETNQVTIEIDWAANRMWKIQLNSNAITEQYEIGPSATISFPYDSFNGILVVAPITQLQSPNSGHVYVNVFTSCKDLQVNQLVGTDRMEYRYTTESGVLSDNSYDTHVLNPTSGDLKMCSEYHFGEQPVSFRQLLKRFVYTNKYIWVAEEYSGYGSYGVEFEIRPQNVSYPTPTANVTPQFNLFQYLMLAYLGVRGGIRKRITLSLGKVVTRTSQVRVTLSDTEATPVPPSGYFVSGINPTSSVRGTVAFVPDTNGGIEFELPFYSLDMFECAFAYNQLGEKPFVNLACKRYLMEINTDGEPNQDCEVTEESAAGEDFTFMRFQGATYFTLPL